MEAKSGNKRFIVRALQMDFSARIGLAEMQGQI
jgi:hypothetical protein